MFVMFTDELFLAFETMLYFYGSLVWAGKVGISCTIYSARTVQNTHLCSRHFLESDFTTAERMLLNFSYMNIPCTLLLFLCLEAAKNVAE
jgi:hypothetical protein